MATSGQIMIQRSKVLWIGEKFDSFNHTEFEHRNLLIDFCDPSEISQNVSVIRGVIFNHNPSKRNAVATLIKMYGPIIIDHGGVIFAIASDENGINDIVYTLGKSDISQDIRDDITIIARHPDLDWELAERIRKHDPGPAPNPELEIEFEHFKSEMLTPVGQLFIRRAFSDCKSLTIKPLPGGKSANVFSASALFKDSPISCPRPLPFFIKLDNRHKIKKELENYLTYTAHLIPFNLRPNIANSRCIIGADEGLLVGDFVEQAEALWTLAQQGKADMAIFSLFNITLRSWRLQVDKVKKNLAESIKGSQMDFFKPERIPPDRLELAFTFGAEKKPGELKEILLNFPPTEHLTCPMHGDLHARNVIARGTDAILIDFALTQNGPIVADSASLEVSLAFGISDSDDDDDSWAALMQTLYNIDFLLRPPPPPREQKPREWLWSCVRTIRLMALSERETKYEYATVIAIYLLRLATYASESSSDNYRKAYAYMLADRTIRVIQSKLEKDA